MLTILDPVAIIDTDTFRWGDPPDVYSVKSIEGLIQDEETGVRFSLGSDRDPLVRCKRRHGEG